MYEIILSPRVESTLTGIHKRDKKLFAQICKSLDKVEENPYKGKSLTGKLKDYYSLRVRDYRIIYEINKKKSVIYILKIQQRKDVYKMD
ncbi:type II toxin-antitoxin system RelE/ParE family toxin [bacterium]|nr:type II toxin-antitoxin system RelE/ParE family toxin [bacterium]